MEELSRKFKAVEIDENQLKEAGIPLIHQLGKGFTFINKPIKKGADYIVNYFISDASKGISKLDNVNDTAKLATVAEGVGDSSNITKSFVKEIKVVDDTADRKKMEFNDSIFYYIKIID